jgi:hypothetical protein
MGLIALPAIPPIIEGLILLGAGLGITHHVAPGKEQREQSIRDLANAMSNAQNDAKTKAAGGTEAATCATGNCPPPLPPECKEKADKVKEALYRNKRALGGGGAHGYLNRMMEQMCGQHGPGTKGWKDHVDQLRGEQGKIKDGINGMKKCPLDRFFSRQERKIINQILNNKIGWGPNDIFFKGSNHPDCLSMDAARLSGRLGDILGVVRPGIF